MRETTTTTTETQNEEEAVTAQSPFAQALRETLEEGFEEFLQRRAAERADISESPQDD
jgi:hypothetical protein